MNNDPVPSVIAFREHFKEMLPSDFPDRMNSVNVLTALVFSKTPCCNIEFVRDTIAAMSTELKAVESIDAKECERLAKELLRHGFVKRQLLFYGLSDKSRESCKQLRWQFGYLKRPESDNTE